MEREAVVLASVTSPHVEPPARLRLGERAAVPRPRAARGRDARRRSCGARGASAAARLVDWVEQLLVGVRDCHRGHVIHRDIKPANIFLESRPGRRRAHREAHRLRRGAPQRDRQRRHEPDEHAPPHRQHGVHGARAARVRQGRRAHGGHLRHRRRHLPLRHRPAALRGPELRGAHQAQVRERPRPSSRRCPGSSRTSCLDAFVARTALARPRAALRQRAPRCSRSGGASPPPSTGTPPSRGRRRLRRGRVGEHHRRVPVAQQLEQRTQRPDLERRSSGRWTTWRRRPTPRSAARPRTPFGPPARSSRTTTGGARSRGPEPAGPASSNFVPLTSGSRWLGSPAHRPNHRGRSEFPGLSRSRRRGARTAEPAQHDPGEVAAGLVREETLEAS